MRRDLRDRTATVGKPFSASAALFFTRVTDCLSVLASRSRRDTDSTLVKYEVKLLALRT